MQDHVVSVGSNSVSISVEALAAESYPDLVKIRRTGKQFQPAVGKERAIAVSYKDLLVVTCFQDRPFAAIASAIDARLNGALKKGMENSDFKARQGETMVLELEERGLGSGNARRVLIVGLGDSSLSGQFVYCGLVGCVIQESINLESEQTMLFLSDLHDANRFSEESFVRVLTCRVAHHLETHGEHGRLKKIRLIVDPEAKKRVDACFSQTGSLCRVCSEPSL